MLKILRYDGEKLNIPKSEIVRYALGGEDEMIDNAIKKCEKELLPQIICKACYDEFDVKFCGDEIDFGFVKVTSRSLKKNLSGCEKVIVFAATLGIECDRYIQKCSLTSPANALVAQGIGAAAIEAWCDKICEILSEEFAPLLLRPRFSPGYGDLSLSLQNDIISTLDCRRKIGLTLTNSLMLTPSKSVTAFVGVSKTKKEFCNHGCAECNMSDCVFKKCGNKGENKGENK